MNAVHVRHSEPNMETPVRSPLLLTPASAALLLAVPESWLRRKAGRRLIPCTFIGKHLRFSMNDIAAIADHGAQRVAQPRRPPRIL